MDRATDHPHLEIGHGRHSLGFSSPGRRKKSRALGLVRNVGLAMVLASTGAFGQTTIVPAAAVANQEHTPGNSWGLASNLIDASALNGSNQLMARGWNNNYLSNAWATWEHWVYIDLGAEYDLDEIRVWNYNDADNVNSVASRQTSGSSLWVGGSGATLPTSVTAVGIDTVSSTPSDINGNNPFNAGTGWASVWAGDLPGQATAVMDGLAHDADLTVDASAHTGIQYVGFKIDDRYGHYTIDLSGSGLGNHVDDPAFPSPFDSFEAGLGYIQVTGTIVPGLSAPVSVSDTTTGVPISLTVPVSNPGGIGYNVTATSYTGPAAGDFGDSTVTPLLIGAGGSEDITVDFTPSTGGLREATLTLTTNDPASPTIDVALSVEVHDPEADVENNLDFGASVLAPAPLDIFADNLGDSLPLTLSAPVWSGGGAAAFSVSSLPPPIPGGAFDNVEITFNPVASGYYEAQLELTTDGPFTPTATVDVVGEVTGGMIIPSVESVSSELLTFDRPAVYSVNGNGMTGQGSSGSSHTVGEGGVAWGTPGNLGAPHGTDFDPEITYDLGGLFTVTAIREWGFNSASPQPPAANHSIIGPDEVEVFAGPDLGSMVSQGTVNFAQAPGVAGYTGNEIAVNYANVRFIRLDIKSNHDGALFGPAETGTNGGVIDTRSLTGLSEIRFETVPGLSAPSSVLKAYNGGLTSVEVGLLNTDSAGRNFTAPGLSGTHAAFFSIGSSPGTLAAGATDEILVNFDSTASGGGTFTATLTINSDDPNQPAIQVELTVEVRDPEISTDSSIAFGALAGPGSTTAVLSVDNFGANLDLTLSNPQFTGDAVFSLPSGLPGPITAGDFADIDVAFDLSSVGVFAGQLTLDTDDPFNPTVTVDLSGEVTVVVGAGDIEITSVSLSSPTRLRIDFEGDANTGYQVKSSADLASNPFTDTVTPAVDGLTTNDIGGGRGVGFVEVDITGPELYFQIQAP